ncbi:hypothetical protein [Glutamicibacter arilaitensis]|uniref:hypothetical protein n=1 Tax=Glutamicibacter arilaitensis TaxID=256701 RepID=UPI001CB8CE35|nr:hypothetical protein [Glutamicibacter arilaitensis]
MKPEIFTIRPTTGADWRAIRDLRIEMIRDTPTAYAESLQDALGHDQAEWVMRASVEQPNMGLPSLPSQKASAGLGQWEHSYQTPKRVQYL